MSKLSYEEKSNLYYEKKNDITIEKYGIKPGFLLNEFYIIYNKGKILNEICNIIDDPTTIEYNYFHIKEERKIKALYQYLDEDGYL